MSGVLVVVETNNGELRAASLEAIAAAKQLGAGPVTALVAGAGIAGAAAQRDRRPRPWGSRVREVARRRRPDGDPA